MYGMVELGFNDGFFQVSLEEPALAKCVAPQHLAAG